MAYQFAGGATDDGFAVLTGLAALEVPTNAVSMSMWIRRNGNQDQFDRIFQKEYNNANTAPYVSYGIEFTTSNNVLFEVGIGAGLFTTSAVALSDGVWTHLLGTGDTSSAAILTLYKNGVSSGTGTPSVGSFPYSGTGNQLDIGTRYATGNSSKIDVGELAIWNAVLTASEAVVLAAGYSALSVRPSNIIFYAPLVREKVDIVGGLPLTMTGTTPPTPIGHPRIILPKRRHPGAFIGTPPPPPPPPAVLEYSQNRLPLLGVS